MNFFSTVIVILAFSNLCMSYKEHENHGEHASSYTHVVKHDKPVKVYSHYQEYNDNTDHHEEHKLLNHKHDFGKSLLHHHKLEENHHHEDYYSHPQYKFDYGVKDHKSGDQKKHWEEREGDKVKGSYTFKEADGTTRVVEYTADKHNGFQAVVKNIGEKHGLHHHYNHHHGYDHHY